MGKILFCNELNCGIKTHLFPFNPVLSRAHLNMDISLALVPVLPSHPSFSRADGLLVYPNPNNADRFAWEVEHIIDKLNRIYGSAGFEIVSVAKGTLIDAYI